MARQRGLSSRLIRSPSRRSVSWTPGPQGTLAITAATDNIFPIGVQTLVDDATLVRTRGEVNVGLSVITGSLDGFSEVAMGLCIVNENAAGIGVTAIPSPVTDIGWDGWFWYWTGSLFGVSATEANAAGTANVRIPIDSKAMRKLRSSDFIVGALAVVGEVGTAQLNATMQSRMLLKLH